MRGITIGLGLFLSTACGDDPAGPDNNGPPTPTAADTVVGVFALAAVNGIPIPAAILNESGYVLQAIASTADLSANGELVIALNTRETVAGFSSEYADTLRGTWSQQGTVVRFTIVPAGESATVGWDGVNLTVALVVATAEGNYVFTKNE